MAYDSQIVRANENLKFCHGGHSHQPTDESFKPGSSLSLVPDPPSCNERGNHGYKPEMNITNRLNTAVGIKK